MTRIVALAMLSGLLIPLGYPPFSLYFLSLFSLIPFLFAISRVEKLLPSLLLALLCGTVAMGIHVYWVSSFKEWAGSLGFVFYLLAVGFHTLLLAILALLFHTIKKRFGASTALLLTPFVWTLMEYAGNFGIFGIPELTGHGQIDNPILKTAAPVLGINYVTFLAVLFNALIVLTLLSWKHRRKGVVALWAFFFCLLAVNHLLFPWQGKKLAQSAGVAVQIALAHPPVTAVLLNDPDAGLEVFSLYLKETRNILNQSRPSLIIWPEMVYPFITNTPGPSRERLKELMTGYPGQILLGGPEEAKNSQGSGQFYNTAFLFDRGEIVDLYQKEHLFPFGEYIPYRPVFGLIERYLPLKLREKEYLGGLKIAPIQSNVGKIGASICLETLFGNIIRKRVRDGAEWLLNLTNDAWFVRSRADISHFFIGRMRALENGRFFVQAASSGISGVVNPFGKVLHSIDASKGPSFTTEITPIREKTFYTRIGLWRFPILFLMSLAGLFLYRK